MEGETHLQKLLEGMQPSVSEEIFAFATARSLVEVPAYVSVIGSFIEDEGVTIIATSDQIRRTSLVQSEPFAKISLAVHSSLTSVGLTAAIATALAGEGISANVVAGYFHDHIFVPWERRHAAFDVLTSLGCKDVGLRPGRSANPHSPIS